MKKLESKPVRRQSRQRRRTKVTRQKLLEAARAVFAEKGIDLTRIDEISERADVGKGTFYYHFKGKPQIVKELIRSNLSELASIIEEKCRNDTEIQDLLHHMIGAHIEFFSNRWADFVLYFQALSDLKLEEGYPGIETPFIEYLQCAEGLLESVIKYRLPQPVLRRIACAIAGLVSGYYSFASIASQDADIDEVFASLRGAMVASLARFVQEAYPSNQVAGSSLANNK
ncbi:MAG: TetR/AcrR family transcriptional regulator [Planctomycetes bacterium]|nr:TetR/AcrR family transcriptional regulator [Planctomycetota bacterium]